MAAKSGDLAAWSSLIARFEDLAVASAVGLSGDLDAAAEIAQEAFAQAVRRIDSLEDPHAFPAWLLTLVRTANNRRTRRRVIDTESLDALGPHGASAALMADEDSGPEKEVLAGAETTQVRNAIERLPEGERCVVALHYLAEMPYADVAEFLGITVSAAKKRAWSAGSRLKEMLPMTTDALAAARPSVTKSFRDTILVFQAIRTADVDLLARLVADDPALADASEDWSADEGFESDLSFSERATALVRAAGTGDLRLVRVLVEAGAQVSGACGCVDGETPLVAAVNIGATDVVEFLIDHGASLDDLAFDGGSTALHVAVHQDDHNMVRTLLTAGADPTLRDRNGRTATEWSVLKRTTRPRVEPSDFLWTRIRPIDLFAPLRRGALVHVPPAYGLGAMRTIYSIVEALDAHFWMLGFAHGPYKQREFEQEVRESRTPSTIGLVSPGHPAERRREFASTLEHLANDPRPKVAMVVPAPGHEHDTTIALPALAADPSVLATIVVAPFTPERGDVPRGTPEGFDARITFDPIRAGLRIWPAIDPAHTNSRDYPNPRHEQLAAEARETLTAYASIDPGLDLPDPTTFDDTALAERAQRLHRYFAHAFRPFEHLAAEPAADTPIDQLLRTVEEILDR
ncbi:MAG: sigma-70 family RNA polymerase sigma factor [Acidimicrobiales bacterium]